jgi:iron complex outermembrane receptor protein
MRRSMLEKTMAHKRPTITLCLTLTCLANGTAVASEDDTTTPEIVVTGTVSKTTTHLTSMVPVDVFSADRLSDTGFTDIARALETTEPELNFPRPVSQPTVSSTRPIFLNGLYPDETLVLVNGKRWHTSAVLDTNLGLGRGTASADLNTIPLSAIDHIEVLRDGASAQYGSDAIAGVVNIILKSNPSGGAGIVQAGVTERGDGANALIAANHGFRIGEGFLFLDAEGYGQESTDRAAIDQRYNAMTWHFGNPAAASYNLAANAAFPLQGLGQIYGDLLVSRKDSMDKPAYEAPGISPLYPFGFAPNSTLILWDVNATVGARGDLPCAFTYDLSNTYGRSSADFYASNTANASLGAASPTVFYSGTPIYHQDVTDLTFNRALPEFAAGGNLTAGAQFRDEHYQIVRGDPDSYVGAGAATLPGFNPRIPVDNSRTAAAGYVDLELSPLQWLTLGGAGRFDHYNDFGGAPTFKFSTRMEATHWLAFRGSAGTGFRAPSMQQDYYNTVSTTATGANKALVNVGTFQVNDPVSEGLGATPLQAEKSHSYSFGTVITPDPSLSVTGGLYRIVVAHRIALTDSQSGPAVTAALAAAGVSNVAQVAFFTNGISTRTTGGYVTVSYKGEVDATPYDLSLAYDRHHTEVVNLERDPVVPSLTLLGQHSQILLTDAQPADKLTAALKLFHGPFSGTLDVTRYGGYTDEPVIYPQYFNPKTLVDLAVSAQPFEGGTLTFGVLNAGDVFPDKAKYVNTAYATFGNAFVYGVVGPTGTDGRSYYLRMSMKF